jgi:hypothetical protein
MNRFLAAVACVAALAGLAYTPVASPAAPGDGWTTIKGRITWDGKAPERDKIDPKNDKVACLSCRKDGVLLDEVYMVNPKNKGLANVFVWVAPLEEDGKLPIHPSLMEIKTKQVHLDQPCCMFEPRCIAIREGQDVLAKNSATIAHNIRWTGHPDFNKGGNVTLPPGKDYTLPALKAQKLPLLVECNIHGWMKGRIAVFNHPYYAVTDADGNFTIKLAPQGKYRLFIYHESGWRNGKDGREGFPITIQGATMQLDDVSFNVKTPIAVKK